MTANAAEATQVDKIQCKWCGGETHWIKHHIDTAHPDKTVEGYSKEFPDAPILSPRAQAEYTKRVEQKMAVAGSAKVTTLHAVSARQASFHEVFELGNVPAALNSKGAAIPVTVFDGSYDADMVPDKDSNYVYDIAMLKDTMLGAELNIPTFIWGHAGTGKSTLPEQICARTNRPMIRVQHTIGMEERDVVGQWTVKDGQTVFQYGPLPMAMQRGWVYLADEYDMAAPGVTALYQAVLEGKSLVIKEAPPELRTVKPHAGFRIFATGNTNGSGDEFGLYQATQIGNAANYERFGIVLQMRYMDPDLEALVLVKQAGCGSARAKSLIEFATKIREAFEGKKISHTISPRTLIYAAKLGIRKGSFRIGITLAFINRLSSIDREVADQMAQRIFDKS